MSQFQLMMTAQAARDARDVAERANVRVAMRGLAMARSDLARARAAKRAREDDAAVRMMERMARVCRR